MNMNRWMPAMRLLTIFSGRALGCFCFSTPMCSQIGTLTPSGAVFVGRVVDVWPTRQGLAGEEPQNVSLAELRHLILERWREVLSADEERYIRTSSDRGAMEIRYALMQRVRFVVTEVS